LERQNRFQRWYDQDSSNRQETEVGDLIMKRYFGAVGAALFAMTLIPSTASAATPALVVTDLNVRAGPGTQYPAVTVFPRNSRVTVIGCTTGITWCDVSGRGVRGWVSARYLNFSHRGDRLLGPAYGASVGLPIITFQIGPYWDHHYRDRTWYRDRSRWDRRPDRRWDRSRSERWEGRRSDGRSRDGRRDR
jgi:uncharacterized protein YraI